MGTAFLYGNGGSGGTGASLTVTAPAGATVTVSKAGKVNTKVAGTDGVAVFKGLATGNWLLYITDGIQTAQKTVTITADYSTAITFFAATIHVTYPAGSTCTATDGVTTMTAPDTSGTWDCVVPNAGTWTVSLDRGFAETVEITQNGEEQTIDKWYLFREGNNCTDVTGGWTNQGWSYDGVACSPVIVNSNAITFVSVGGQYRGGGSVKLINLAGFRTLIGSGHAEPPGAIPKAGIWSGKSLNSPVACQNFSSGGNVTFSVDISSFDGSYYVAFFNFHSISEVAFVC